MTSRRVHVRRTVIFLAVVFWLAVMAAGIFALYTISRDGFVLALHHLSVGVLLLTFSGLGMYVELKRAGATRSARRYCVEHFASSFVYLVIAGFMVDPLPVASKSVAPKALAPYFYAIAGLGVLISIVKCSLGCLKPHRYSVSSTASSVADGEELRSLRERLSNSSPMLNERPVAQSDSLLDTRSSMAPMNYDAPVATNPFVLKGVRSAQPVAVAGTPPVKKSVRAVQSSSASDVPCTVSQYDDNARNPFAADIAQSSASGNNPFDADVSHEVMLDTLQKADGTRNVHKTVERARSNPFDADVAKDSSGALANPFDADVESGVAKDSPGALANPFDADVESGIAKEACGVSANPFDADG